MPFSLREEILSLLGQRRSKTMDVRELFDRVETTDDAHDVITELELMETQGVAHRIGDTRIRLSRKFTQAELVAQVEEDDLIERERKSMADHEQRVNLIAELNRIANAIQKTSKLLNSTLADELRQGVTMLRQYAKSLEG